jgi:hypothetical protein
MLIARLQHSKHHMSIATFMHGTAEELWVVVFCVVSIQRLYLENQNVTKSGRSRLVRIPPS